LLSERFPNDSQPSLEAFNAASQSVIRRDHEAAREAGVDHPEVFWPSVAARAFAPLQRLSTGELDALLDRHAQLARTVRLMAGAAEVLERLRARGLVMGLLSNSQPYTLSELHRALGAAGLGLDLFHPDWQVLSFRFGFSKPNPHLFRVLSGRAAAFGFQPSEILMAGDRQDNDIEPALKQGWQTWRLTAEPAADERAGDWRALGAFLREE
jgi:FMN phosphatase YigB (HAD superfamily)